MAGLRTVAEADLGAILEDGVYGFAWPITITDPNANVGNLQGFSNDISQVVDPETGMVVSGRSASIAVRIASLTAEGLGIPVGIADSGSKPWRVTFDDISGTSYEFKVAQSNPDRAIGLVTCLLEAYVP